MKLCSHFSHLTSETARNLLSINENVQATVESKEVLHHAMGQVREACEALITSQQEIQEELGDLYQLMVPEETLSKKKVDSLSDYKSRLKK